MTTERKQHKKRAVVDDATIVGALRKYTHGLSVEVIAADYGVSVATLRTWVSSAGVRRKKARHNWGAIRAEVMPEQDHEQKT